LEKKCTGEWEARGVTSSIVGEGFADRVLSDEEVRSLTAEALGRAELDGKRVLVIIPDSTRTAPVPLMFRLLCELLRDRVAALGYLVALGTHPLMTEDALNRHLGVSTEDRERTYSGVRVCNHRWDRTEILAHIGTIPRNEIESITDGMLSQDLRVTVNRLILDYDQLIVLGPVFPHEVVGYSGGTKYFFPGISGPEVTDFTHWLGALMTSMAIIGTRDTPVRRVIDRAAAFIDIPKLFIQMVVSHAGLAGLYIGEYPQAWSQAAELSSSLHVRYVDRPFKRVLSIMPAMYDDIWTAAKGMYKVEPVISDGGEVVIYAPHIDEISYSHGRVLDQVGYHVRDYFTKQWEQFKDMPWGVLAHSTHLRGVGAYDAESGVEHPRIRVTLATGISRERCERVNLGYVNPATIDLRQWEGREAEGVLVVARAGETLYRLQE
jgi:nickel-dependent lactate racemase